MATWIGARSIRSLSSPNARRIESMTEEAFSRVGRISKPSSHDALRSVRERHRSMKSTATLNIPRVVADRRASCQVSAFFRASSTTARRRSFAT
jgi:hypothetical protein